MKLTVTCVLLVLAGVSVQAAILARVVQPPFSIIQIGDIHAGTGNSSSGVVSNNFDNAITTILNSNAAWNVKMIISPGDCYEQRADGPLATLASTNLPPMLKRLQTNGISVFVCPGNHDSDADGLAVNFWTNLFPKTWFTNDSAFWFTRTTDDTRDMAFAMTNSGMKILVLGYRFPGPQEGWSSQADVISAYATYNSWVSSNATFYSGHHIIAVAHFLVDEDGTLSLSDDAGGYPHIGPGIYAWTNCLSVLPNPLMALCGHTRTTPTTVTFKTATDGHQVPVVKFNTQAARFYGYATNGAAFKLYTFYPSERRMEARTYSADLGAFLTNGQFKAATVTPFSGTDIHNFTHYWKHVQ